MSHYKKTLAYGNHQLTLETGEIARQASGAVVVSLDDTVVLVTVVGRKDAKPDQDFFPLTVDYQERTYAAGKIPGGFFRREGRPSEKEVLTSRLIDRPLRPLFPAGFYNEVQIVATVISSDNQIDSDIPAMIGASAALALSGIPFDGPIGAARVGYLNGEYVLNPTAEELELSKMNPWLLLERWALLVPCRLPMVRCKPLCLLPVRLVLLLCLRLHLANHLFCTLPRPLPE